METAMALFPVWLGFGGMGESRGFGEREGTVNNGHLRGKQRREMNGKDHDHD